MARTPNPGDQVLFVSSTGQLVPATVIVVKAGSTATVDLALQSPGSPWNATVENSVQNTDGTTAATWNYAPFSGLKLDSGTATAGTTGTISKSSGQFILSSGQTVYTLTNTLVTTTSIVRVVKQTAEGSSRNILSVVPTANTVTVTMSGTVGADTTFGFYVVNPS